MINRTLLLAALVSFAPLGHAGEPTLPEEDANPGATRDQAIDAFTRDCHATLTATAWVEEEEKTLPECMALDVYQNCNPDTFGCYGELDACQAGCQPVCNRCQDTCAGGCDACKTACTAGDSACIRKCAEVRADCRGRCVKGLKQCQTTECTNASQECMKKNAQRLKGCQPSKCDDYVECYDAQTDYETADQKCRGKLIGYDDFCRNACTMSHGLPLYYLDEEYAPDAPLANDGPSLAKLCTAEAQCPADYAKVAPYLASFCGGTTTDASFKALEAEVARGAISKRTLGLVFNAYGAMHGYQFKKETWMNGFFYGQGGAWLPSTCKAKIKTVASAKVMPFRLTKLRDRVKQIWSAAR